VESDDLEVDVLADFAEILLFLGDYAYEREHVHSSSFVSQDLPKHKDL